MPNSNSQNSSVKSNITTTSSRTRSTASSSRSMSGYRSNCSIRSNTSSVQNSPKLPSKKKKGKKSKVAERIMQTLKRLKTNKPCPSQNAIKKTGYRVKKPRALSLKQKKRLAAQIRMAYEQLPQVINARRLQNNIVGMSRMRI